MFCFKTFAGDFNRFAPLTLVRLLILKNRPSHQDVDSPLLTTPAFASYPTGILGITYFLLCLLPDFPEEGTSRG